MFLLDTNICSAVINCVPAAIASFEEYSDSSIALSATVMGELIDMAARSERQGANFQQIWTFLDAFVIHPIDAETAEIYGQLKAAVFDRYAPKDRKQRRRTKLESLGIGDNDLWIAATALQHRLTLITADRDFDRLAPLCNLTIDTWL
ncbi:MAG: type II toxin-antitoxin system VapC family toxin [Geitlerinemataceae cyanobacterium]